MPRTDSHLTHMRSLWHHRAVFEIVQRHLPSNVEGARLDDAREDLVTVVEFARFQLLLVVQASTVLAEVQDRNGQLARRTIDPIRRTVRQAVQDAIIDSSDYGVAVGLLQATEAAWEFEPPPGHDHGSSESEGSARAQAMLEDPMGLNAISAQEIIAQVLPETPEQIIQKISQVVRVRHLEPVLRQDAARRYFAFRSELTKTLSQEGIEALRALVAQRNYFENRGYPRRGAKLQELQDELLRPQTCYFAAPNHLVSPIIRRGFKALSSILPGRPPVPEGSVGASLDPISELRHSHGVSIRDFDPQAPSDGNGIQWMTPNSVLPSLRLIVCAVTLGRVYRPYCSDEYDMFERHDARYAQPTQHFDSATSRSGIVSYHPDAVLPCYVIELEGLTEALASYSANTHVSLSPKTVHPRLQRHDLAPGDAKREKQRKKAAGMKFFSSGIGPSRRTQFTVEDVGSVDDDEEDYGNWQEDRHAS